jgi:acyl dehydratase
VPVKYYFEDFPVGNVREFVGPPLTEAEIVDFAQKYDPQFFHVDPVRAKDSIYGGLIASGFHTIGICMRLACDGYLLETANMGSPGVREIKWLGPVRPGDQLRLRITAIEATPSRSKPDRGVITHRWDAFNQRDEKVLEMIGLTMLQRRTT